MESTFWVHPVYRNGRFQDQAGGYDTKDQADHTARMAAESWEDIQTPSFARVEVVERPRDEPSGRFVDKMGRRIQDRNGRVVSNYFPGAAKNPRVTLGEIR